MGNLVASHHPNMHKKKMTAPQVQRGVPFYLAYNNKQESGDVFEREKRFGT